MEEKNFLNQEGAKISFEAEEKVDSIVDSYYAAGESKFSLEAEHDIDKDDSTEFSEDNEYIEKVWDDYDMDKLYETALQLVQNSPNILEIRDAILKLKELHKTKAQQEIGKLAEITDKEEYENRKDAIEKQLEAFEAVWSIYKEKRKQYLEELAREQEENYKKKLALLDELKQLIDSNEPFKVTYDAFNKIRDKWQEIGKVPPSKNNELWLSYNHYVALFMDKIKQYKELRDLDMKKNLEQKIELCEMAEQLLFESNIHVAFKKYQEYFQHWKEIGPVPADKRDEIWERFKLAGEKLREKRLQYYQEIEKKYHANLEAKQAIVQQAKAIASGGYTTLKEWNDANKKINELIELYKNVGPVPREQSERIWQEFRSILESFQRSRKQFFEMYQEELNANYHKKLNICLAAEAIKNSTDWKNATNELLRLQEEWKKIGPVPTAVSDVIWKRFRAACDEFFTRKKQFYESIYEEERQNLEKKRRLIDELKSFQFTDDKKKNLSILQEYQRKWYEIGRVPIEEKNKLQDEWKKLLNDLYSKLNLQQNDFDFETYQDKIKSWTNLPGGKDKIWQELKKLRFQLAKLQHDVQLWENNLSFFSNSKNADVLLKEFNEKIERARNEIKVLKEKEKFLTAILNEKTN
ncbi:MAG: DUF349 domain-containing protein [Bacteroidales bacterium]|nr:DUF349 domain-containing protein [Bacteroidales bacterium]